MSRVKAMIIAIICSLPFLMSASPAAAQDCVSHNAHWQIYPGQSKSPLIRLGSADAHLLVCNDSRGRLSSSQLTVFVGLTSPGAAAGWNFFTSNAYKTSSTASVDYWRVDGYGKPCIGVSKYSWCVYSTRFAIKAEARVASGYIIFLPSRITESCTNAPGTYAGCLLFKRIS